MDQRNHVMRKIAMPMAKGDLCDHFEEFQYFLIFDFNNPLSIQEDIKSPPSREIKQLPAWLLEAGVTDIIARGIDHELIKKLNQNKIHVFIGVKKKKPEDLVRDYLKKNLETNEQMCY
jgi:predicted Fe-Mo cluster-binding NifX family protein